jgi:hypothetical protein
MSNYDSFALHIPQGTTLIAGSVDVGVAGTRIPFQVNGNLVHVNVSDVQGAGAKVTIKYCVSQSFTPTATSQIRGKAKGKNK